MNDVTVQRFPWEPVPVEETVTLLQRDFAYAVKYTAILVHSNNEAFAMLVNTPRGQIVPRGECKFTNGVTFELQDVGMPQPRAPTMTIRELTARIMQIANELGLELGK